MNAAWRDIAVIAHRCGGAAAPENSLSGLLLAARRGWPAVEFDVMLSADGVPVVIHDETLERTTDGWGAVAAHSYLQLSRLNCAHRFAGAMAEPIPRLADILAACRKFGLLANVEIKPSRGLARQTGEVVARAVAGVWADLKGDSAEILLSSFSPEALLGARNMAPQLERALLVEGIPDDWWDQMASLGATALHCDARHLSMQQLAGPLNRGIPVRCYTVNDFSQARALFAMGVSSIFSDFPDAVRSQAQGGV